jgi:acetyltransferase-like isoleucine patch superfamily enzyme
LDIKFLDIPHKPRPGESRRGELFEVFLGHERNRRNRVQMSELTPENSGENFQDRKSDSESDEDEENFAPPGELHFFFVWRGFFWRHGRNRIRILEFFVNKRTDASTDVQHFLHSSGFFSMIAGMTTDPFKASVHKTLMDKKDSSFKKYKKLFVGDKGFGFLLKYELIILLFSRVPGAIGFVLRKIFYPRIINKVGRGVVFGRNITLRHPHKIVIGDNTYIDDNVVLDAKGNGNKGMVIGQNVIIGRNSILSCKEGFISLGDFCNVSANCSLLSETKIEIGEYSFLAGQCYLVAGGNHSFERTDIPIMFQPSINKGGIVLGEDVWLGASVCVLDGVSVGRGSVVGAGSVVKDSLPAYSIAVGLPAVKIKERGRP